MLTVQNKDVRKAVWTNKEVRLSCRSRKGRTLTPVRSQVEIVNELQLLTAKPVTYLINLSEKDYIR